MKRMNVALALLLGTALAGPSLSNAQMSTNSQSNQSSAVGSITDNVGAFHIDRFEKRGRKIYAVGWFLGGTNSQSSDQSSAYFSPGTMMGDQSSMNDSWSSGASGSSGMSGSSSMNGSSYAGDMSSSWSDTLGWGASDTLGLAPQWDTTGNAYSDQMSSSPSWTGSGVSGRSSFGYNAGGSTGIGRSYGSSSSVYGNGATQLGMGSSVGTPGSRDAGNIDALSSSTTTTGGSTDLRTSGGIGTNGDMLDDTLGLGLSGSAGVSAYGPGIGYDADFQTGANYDTTVDYSAAVNPVGSATVTASGDLNTDWAPGDTVFNENLIGPNPTIAASGSLGAGYDVTPGSVVTGGSATQGSMSTQGNVALQGNSGVSGSVSTSSDLGMSNSYGTSGSLGMNGGVNANADLGASGSIASGTFYGDTVGMVGQGTSMRISSIDETALPVTFLGASCETISMQLGAANAGFVHVGNPSGLADAVGGPITVELRPSTAYAQGIDVSYNDVNTPVVATYVSDVSGNTSLCEVSKLINGDAARTAIVDKLNQLIGAPITGPVRNGIAR